MNKTVLLTLLGVALAIFSWPQTTVSNSMAIVTVTAYAHSGYTSSGTRVREGIIALSRDLEHRLQMDFGDKIRLEGLGEYEFRDRMAARCRQKVDVYMKSKRQALRFGVKRNVLLVKVV